MDFARGIVVSAVAGYYFVEHENKIYLCRGRGRLRIDNLAPMAGDIVLFSPGDDDDGIVEQVLPRRNFLPRPAVANVDAVVVVLAPQHPQPNLLMVDKLLALLISMELATVICVNKADLDCQQARQLAEIYSAAGFDSLICSALTGQGLAELSQMLGQRTVVLAGQSGAGKSHISSQIASGQLKLPIQVGKLSAKIGRGKHTTRQVSLLPLAGGGKLADTPGFSVFDLEMESGHLHRFYPEFINSGQCKFAPCFHIHEPDCAVKARLQRGEISSSRYENYVKIYTELQEREANRY
jgi:ribosome biogenesis GTPase